MQFLGESHLSRAEGGLYSRAEAARARLDRIEQQVLPLWCVSASVDAFQHWIFAHPDEAAAPARMNAVWADLVERFMPGVDWSGLDDHKGYIDWRALHHIFQAPFYMIEYALAQLGAVQIAASAREHEREAVRRYRAALALGATRPLPELFAAAGARFAFDADTFRSAVQYLEGVIAEMEAETASA
jgi:oligoendopeptidase F